MLETVNDILTIFANSFYGSLVVGAVCPAVVSTPFRAVHVGDTLPLGSPHPGPGEDLDAEDEAKRRA